MTTTIIIKKSFKTYRFTGMALDPIHVGTGGCRLGRVDNTIVRDPVTQIPKIPGSSLAGVMRAYVAMARENQNPNREIDGKKKPYYPDCAGQGGESGHCGQNDCLVCTVFGFAKSKDNEGGFAGLAGFSDMHVLLFPVASQMGPQWITCPMALRQLDNGIGDVPEPDALYHQADGQPINLGWLLLPVKAWDKFNYVIQKIKDSNLTELVIKNLGIVSDKLFTHIVNSNLEVRTSVAIDPATGAAKDRALFSYEALPRGTVLVWDVTCRNPKHFKINGKDVEAVKSPDDIKSIVTDANSYFEHLGIGGMGTRGMGRLRVLNSPEVQK
ncbi:MAG: type III-B CRISPR module RAMP protein Cmr4 [Candidatus Omnitrophica bacterium]|nr:type III-B CRISPR module RAMP protein Cmr4 [Candidatus Omnitrophota bacterium]